MQKLLRSTSLTVAIILVGTFALAQSKTPSLADAARENRKTKPQSERVVWTNENIASVGNKDAAPVATPAAPAAEAEKADAPAPELSDAKKECDKTKDAECADPKSKADAASDKSDGFKAKLKQMQDDLAELQKEATLNEREWKLAQAAYYGDAGTQLRNQKSFADDQSGHQKDTDRLQKAIQDQQKKIDELKEAARKEGVSL